jgi:hypothetical protein
LLQELFSIDYIYTGFGRFKRDGFSIMIIYDDNITPDGI